MKKPVWCSSGVGLLLVEIIEQDVGTVAADAFDAEADHGQLLGQGIRVPGAQIQAGVEHAFDLSQAKVAILDADARRAELEGAGDVYFYRIGQDGPDQKVVAEAAHRF